MRAFFAANGRANRSRRTFQKNPKLQQYIAEAVARCSNWGNNRVILGNEGAVAPLVEFLHGSDPILLRHTCSALNNLSEDPANCIIMHRSKAIDVRYRSLVFPYVSQDALRLR